MQLVEGATYRVDRDPNVFELSGRVVRFKRYTRWMGMYLMAVVDVLFVGTHGTTVEGEWLVKPHYLTRWNTR